MQSEGWQGRFQRGSRAASVFGGSICGLGRWLLCSPFPVALADEGGVSFWTPGFFGSLAAVSQQAPGWSVTSVYYHTSVSAGGDVARAREITIGRIPANPAIALAASSRG